MIGARTAFETWRRNGGRRCRFTAIAFAIASLLGAGGAPAQAPPHAVVEPGEAAVTGFSGAIAPISIAPGEDPATKTFIDVSGPSLRIVDLRRLGGRPAGQVVAAPKPITVPASLIGQVFGVALDGDPAPNVYVAASSAYGLPIVAPGADRSVQHVRAGAPKAAFMQGLWGRSGGPGSIYKIDGTTGRVSLFATVTTDGRPNSGAALGALAFDRDSKTLFVADRESGLIHRFSTAGAHLGVYDHAVTGRAAQGLPALRTTGKPINVADTSFNSADPATWNYAPPGGRTFGVAVRDHRLYYAIADGLQIWSVGLGPDGAFGDDAIIELAVPPSSGPTEIASIAFDDQGRMLLAERPDTTGAFSFEPLSVAAIGRVLRYAIVGQAAGGRRVWQEVPDEYAVGFAGDLRNANGGVAVGYNYDYKGDISLGSCGGFLWETGEDLRDAADPSLADTLSKSGPLHVDGLQGQGQWDDRPRDAPPLSAYFVGYGDGPWTDAAHGRMGAIAIRRDCTQAQAAIGPPVGGRPAPPRPTPPTITPPPPPIPTPPPLPPKVCKPGETRRVDTGACVPGCSPPDVQIGGKCCPPAALAATAACSNGSCPPGQMAVGPSNFCCDANRLYSGSGGAPACCPQGLVNGQCVPHPICTPGASGCPACPSGYLPIGGSCCASNQSTSTGVCCPTGTVAGGTHNAQCVPIVQIPPGQMCCVAGKIPTSNGVCCPAANVTTAGVCCTGPVDPNDRSVCPIPKRAPPIPIVPSICASGYSKMPDGSCCNARYVSPDGRSCNRVILPLPRLRLPPPVDCAAGGRNFVHDPDNPRGCIPCGRGLRPNANGTACVPVQREPRLPPRATCATLGPNFIRDPRNPSACVPCGPGAIANPSHTSCNRFRPGGFFPGVGPPQFGPHFPNGGGPGFGPGPGIFGPRGGAGPRFRR